MMQVRTGPGIDVAPRGRLAVAIQCACGWGVLVSDPQNRESHYDLRDRAEAELDTHVTAAGTPACEPWIHL